MQSGRELSPGASNGVAARSQASHRLPLRRPLRESSEHPFSTREQLSACCQRPVSAHRSHHTRRAWRRERLMYARRV